MRFSDPRFFWIFLPLCVVGFVVLGRFGRRSAIGFLAFMSLLFYAVWNPVYLLVLLGSIFFNYGIAIKIGSSNEAPNKQTGWLALGIVANLLMLGYFKYFFPLLGFFQGEGWTSHSFGQILLPLGISFFTFTQIAYLVDLKQGAAQRESLITYVFFVTFFPHLIAGPILHHQDIMPQVRENRPYRLNSMDVSLGVTWFAMGLFKKTVIADHLAPIADEAFAHSATIGLRGGWLGLLMYAMQLYFDFSGYSDMAVGLARIFSIRFPYNFNSPFKAGSIIDYWQRWHMTLTNYIMDYLYGPILLAISRRRLNQGKKTSRKAVATFDGFTNMVVFPTMSALLIAGIWHGAGLQFLAYGFAHGVFLTVNHAWRTFVSPERSIRGMMAGPAGVVLTFVSAVLAFVLFRSASAHEAGQFYKGLFGFHGLGSPVSSLWIGVLCLLLLIVWTLPNTQEILGEQYADSESNWSVIKPWGWRPSIGWCLAATAIFLFSIAYTGNGTSFIYFQF